jgi:hypothetical protein
VGSHHIKEFEILNDIWNSHFFKTR